MSWLAERIEHWPTERLLPYARNARLHSSEQVAQIAASIAEFGFVNPCLVGADRVLVAGHLPSPPGITVSTLASNAAVVGATSRAAALYARLGEDH